MLRPPRLTGPARDDALNREAAFWLQLAAARGHVNAPCLLGLLHMHGNGVRQDDDEAMRWFLVAAERGHPAVKVVPEDEVVDAAEA